MSCQIALSVLPTLPRSDYKTIYNAWSKKDGMHIHHLLLGQEGEGVASGTSSGGAAHAVQVRAEEGWRVIVHDTAAHREIHTPRNGIRTDQHLNTMCDSVQ